MSALPRCRSLAALGIFGAAGVLCAGFAPASAQSMDHSKMQMPASTTAPAAPPAATKAPARKAAPGAATPASVAARTPPDPHAGHAMPMPAKSEPAAASAPRDEPVDHAAMGHAPPKLQAADAVDHAAMGHDAPAEESPVDHAAMGHDEPADDMAMDHAAMGHDEPAEEKAVDHAAMGHDMSGSSGSGDHAGMGHAMPAPADAPRTPIPVVTAADRAAAFPDIAAHDPHDRGVHSYWLLDRLEAFDADGGTGVEWEALSWIGTDRDRLWLRSEGERSDGSIESADVEVLVGRNIARWWDAVVGIRQDFGEGTSQTFAAFGVMGLAPYKFEVEATAYIGQSGQTAARFEAEYDTLLTNRLILQWQAEMELYGRNDERRGIGSGLSTFEAGLRLRYEVTRQFAPYIGVVWERALGNTADFRRAEGDDTNDVRLVAGVRIWF